ncbi:MAG: BadF/BadG/BcrA/BcrD ATPase family protein [Gemmatimonadota bacterium]
MRCVVGIDLGSTTTKAVLLDEDGAVVGQGITNSRSSYEVACGVVREEALTAARFSMLERAAAGAAAGGAAGNGIAAALKDAFRLEMYLDQLAELRAELLSLVTLPALDERRAVLEPALASIMDEAAADAPSLFAPGARRRSDFFRDLAGAAFMAGAERVCEGGKVPFAPLVSLYDRAILSVETRLHSRSFSDLLERAAARLADGPADGLADGPADGPPAARDPHLRALIADVGSERIEELAFVGTGYGRQTLPFPKEAIRSEILCHGRGAHWFFPETRTVLDIGGQDTKAIQLDEAGVVTSFQMNDRCAAGCGRYLGYIANELNLGLHELGPLALQARKTVRVNSTCTVFAGAELRQRLALGERRDDILAGLHRAMMLRAMSLLARSGGIEEQFTFTGGVCNNPMATRVLAELAHENYGEDLTINTHPDSIYMGAMGAALFALDDLRAGKPSLLSTFAPADERRELGSYACGEQP